VKMRQVAGGWWLVALLVAACMPEAIDVPPVTRDVTGEWNYSYYVSAGAEDICQAGGTMVLTQNGTVITGTAQQYSTFCTHLAGSLTSAGFTDSLVTIVAGACTFSAEHNPSQPDSIAGSATCTIPGFTYVGTWRAERVGPQASLVITPGDREVVGGASHQYQAVLRDAAGRVLNGRVITWSSGDPAVATVTAQAGATNLATVNTLNNGTTSITAITGSLAALSTVTVSRPTFVSVSAGGNFNCALTGAGAAWCWGQLDAYDPGNTAIRSPLRVPSTVAFASLSVGGLQTCGLTAAGAAWCWGRNLGGVLGTGDTVSSMTPRAVTGGLVFVKLVAGSGNTCGLTAAGAAYCWGSGPLGSGSTGPVSVPTAVSGGLSFAAIESWSDHTCGVTAGGAGWCWGENLYGALGNGSTSTVAVTTPVAVAGGLAFSVIRPTALSACGLTSAGAVHCWGNGVEGLMGDGTKPVTRNAPAGSVSGAHVFTALDANYSNACALKSSGQVWCWGRNNSGQVGDGTQIDRDVPTLVTGGLVFTQISVGSSMTCGIAGGVAYCWGYNQFGGVGDGTTAQLRLVPTRVLGQP
jgi:hypothetical protein